jgi:ATP/maltotriose-dependent transcriptional regulator MalT
MAHPTLEHGREAFRRNAWGQAWTLLSAADLDVPLDFEDLQRLGDAAFMLGRDEDAAEIAERAHRQALAADEPRWAARSAFWLGLVLLDRGQLGRASGWFARAERVLEAAEADCVERGYLLVPAALRSLQEGDHGRALAAYAQALEIARRFGDADLALLGRLGQGEARIAAGDPSAGVTLLDEVMVAITADDVSPKVVGIAYCTALELLAGIFDLQRAQEWTRTFTRWCEAQPDLVAFRGLCRLHRARLMQLRGDWHDADDEAGQALAWFSAPNPDDDGIGEALYQRADLRRLQGRIREAETLYREASRRGRRPEPGFALLRLEQGDPRSAAASIRRALAEAPDQPARSRLLEPAVEIALAAGDAEAARRWADELGRHGTIIGGPWLEAMALRADGAVRLHLGEAEVAIGILRTAWTAWHALGAPFEAARVRVLIARASRALGDDDAAAMELDAARQVFVDLGAESQIRALDALGSAGSGRRPGGLTMREVQVLRLVASGRTNRVIATDLVLSEKTVARHVANIFTKLGLSSRSAATAFAYEQGLMLTASEPFAPQRPQPTVAAD